MANALNTNITPGSTVRLTGGELMVVEDGYGLYSFTSGTAVFGKINGQTIRASGYDIVAVVETPDAETEDRIAEAEGEG